MTILTVKKAAAYLKQAKEAVYKLAVGKKIPAFKVEKFWHLKKTDYNHSTTLQWIDAMKGIAMLLVIMTHAGIGKNWSGLLFMTVRNGRYGAVLFFLISAFLLHKSLYSYFDKNTYSFRSITRWIKKKFLRLIPLFYLAIIFGLCWGCCDWWLGNEKEITFGNVISHLFFIHGFFPRYSNSILGVEWYIGVLAMFICLVPLIFKYVNNFSKSIFVFSLSVPIVYHINRFLISLNPFSNKADIRIYNDFVNFNGFFEHLPVLLLGIVLYYVYKHLCEAGTKNKLLSYTLLLCSIFLIYRLLLGMNPLFFVNTHTMWGLTFSLLVISQMIHQNKLVCNKFFQIMGRYSLPIYLFHFYLTRIYKKSHIIKIDNPAYNWLAEFSFTLISSLLLAFVLVKFIDTPLITWLTKDKKKSLFRIRKRLPRQTDI